MVLLILPLAFAGIARSTAAASLTLAPMSGGVYASGSGWTPNGVVTFYFDSQNAAHMVTTVKASSAGSFNFVAIPIGSNVALAPHTIIAVQGANMATATYTPSSVSPPDDRLLNPILAIQNSLSTVNTKLDDIKTTLASGGDFYEFVNQWFNHLDAKVSDVGDKVDAVEEKLDKSLEVLAYYEDSKTLSTAGEHVVIKIVADQPCLYTVSLNGQNLDDGDWCGVYQEIGVSSTWQRLLVLQPADAIMGTATGAVTFASYDMAIRANVGAGNIVIWRYTVMVQGLPGTTWTVTIDP